MRRLLTFLVETSLAGGGDHLKAYSVAVDGLGREPDFDPQSDSYPRVQVGRLRRMLAMFYAREGTPKGIALTIPVGAYRVEATAAPHLLPERESTSIGDAPAPRAKKNGTITLPQYRGLRGTFLALLAILLLAIGGWALWRSWQRPPATGTARLAKAPSLALMPLEAPPSMRPLVNDANGILLDALRRTWVVRLYPGDAAKPGETDYRLSGAIDGGALRLRLERRTPEALLWTGQVLVAAGAAKVGDALTSTIAELVQPYGVIATDQRAGAGGLAAAPGYPCRLLVDRYRRDRRVALYSAARQCIGRTLVADPGNAAALAGSSILTLDTLLYFDPAARDRPQQALALARQAMAANPFEPLAHFAAARASLFLGSCAVAVDEGQRAIDLNPYDPDMMSVVALVFRNCDDPRAEGLLRRAIQLDPDTPAQTYATLVSIALERGDYPAALSAARQVMPRNGATPPLNDIFVAVALVANGDVAGARTVWRRLEIAAPALAADPERIMKTWQLPPRRREMLLRFLREGGLIPAVPPAAPPP